MLIVTEDARMGARSAGVAGRCFASRQTGAVARTIPFDTFNKRAGDRLREGDFLFLLSPPRECSEPKTMNGLARTCAALAVGIFLAGAMTGCGALCQARAKQDINELKRIVPGLLPKAVAETVMEDDDCESGSGGFLVFRARRTMTSEQIFEKFLAKGWDRIDGPQDGCALCVDGLDGVTTERDGHTVYLRISDSEDGTMDILAAFA
ncbi:hypothetical protein ABGB14_43655 [Nonomuraea sp. B10E15]|uniref:hypothetical protein n=1 Tax=Nonomuraea sp. B10E15 TaxID=3153560 RepID=UPI00325F50D1